MIPVLRRARAAGPLPAGNEPADGLATAGSRTQTAAAGSVLAGGRTTTGGPGIRSAVATCAAVLRRHWLLAWLLAAGLVLRLLALIAYQPALIYVDTLKYLYNSYPGADPVGYKAPLKLILLAGNLDAVAAIQHLAGLVIGCIVYLVLLRAGTSRWLAALAAAPVLLDGYQLQIEQTVMPDIWFELLIAAGLAVLLWKPAVSLRAAVGAGLILGASATIRQVGEILIVPALVFLLAASGGWRARIARAATLTAAFAVPVAAYCAGSLLLTGHFWLASGSPSVSTYGQLAAAADCQTLRLPAAERALCPNPRQQARGPDWLDHDRASPLKKLAVPPGQNKYALVARFNEQVLRQQPERAAAAFAADAVKLFALTRTSAQGGTPISRWQFQDSYPVYAGATSLSRAGTIIVLVHPKAAGGPVLRLQLDPRYGGKVTVIRPVAAFLRGYQLHGGYTPGPAFLLFALTGLAGSLAAARRRAGSEGDRRLALACLLWFGSGTAILLASDVFQFSWRYQLPALVTLPPAGAAGIAVVASLLRRGSQARRAAGTVGAASADGQAAELATPAAG